MKRSVALLLASACPFLGGWTHGIAQSASPPPANTYLVWAYSGSCAQPPNTNPNTQYYVDSATGNDANSGLAPGSGNAWASLTHAAATLSTTGGDTVNVYTGSGVYTGIGFSGKNYTSFTTYQSVTGQTPVVNGFTFNNSSKIIIRGFKIQALQGAGLTSNYLIDMTPSGANTDHDIVLYGNDMSSADFATVQGWSQAQWVTNAKLRAINLDGQSAVTSQVTCIAVNNNTIRYTRIGIQAISDYVMMDSNIEDWIGEDFNDFSGNHSQFSNNTGTNSIDDGSSNHNDFWQGQLGRASAPQTFTDIRIFNNSFTELASSAAAVPLTTWNTADAAQCFSDFNLDWDSIQLYNNICLASSNNGISWQSIHNSFIADNTSIYTGTGGSPVLGILVQDFSSGGATASNNTQVFNNIVSDLSEVGSSMPTVTYYNNISVSRIDWYKQTGSRTITTTAGTYTNPPVGANINNILTAASLNGTVFTTFVNSTSPSYDMHLPGGSPAKAAGTITAAPVCINGTARTAPVDAGAYC